MRIRHAAWSLSKAVAWPTPPGMQTDLLKQFVSLRGSLEQERARIEMRLTHLRQFEKLGI